MMPEKKSQTDRLTAKDAAQAAAVYLQGLIPGVKEIRVEEVELLGEEEYEYWRITLGFHPEGPYSLLGPREYKVLDVDAQSGEVKKMKIRSG